MAEDAMICQPRSDLLHACNLLPLLQGGWQTRIIYGRIIRAGGAHSS